MYGQSNCRACGVSIIFLTQIPNEKNPNPRSNPLNASPHKNGNLRWIRGEGYEVLTGDVLKAAHEKNEPLYLSHFANCPRRAEFGKGKK